MSAKQIGCVVLCLFGALTAGCASTKPAEPTRSIEDILAQASDPEAYGEPERCLRLSEYDQVEILNDQALLFRGRGDKVWLNRLRSRCVGLRRNSTLEFDLHTTSACNLDTVAAVDNYFFFWQRTSASCALGKFEPISPQQAELLKAELK